MKPQGSQGYGVDNRYRGMKPAQDNKTGQQFLNQYVQQKRLADKDPIGDQRQQQGRVIMPAMGGTVAVSDMPSNITNTDAQASYRNPFRARHF
jgi:hypothetical protein